MVCEPPKGSLVVVCGYPGSGKTVYCAAILYNQALRGSKGVYVSFIEDKEYFFRNMLGFGMNFKRLEDEKKIVFLDITSPTETSLEAVTNKIFETVESLNADLLVIDSFNALEVTIPKKVDVRVFLHHILGRIVRRMDCTSYIIVEGEEAIREMPSYIADAVIVLGIHPIEGGRFIRKLQIIKTRWGEKDFAPKLFSLHEGFKVFEKYRFEEPKIRKRLEPIPDINGYFSSGIEDLDRVLGGGYPKGSVVLWDVGENVPFHAFAPFIIVTECNFANLKRLVIVLPTKGVDAVFKKRLHEECMDEEAFGRNMFIVQYATRTDSLKPYMIEFDPNLEMLQEKISSTISGYKKKIGGPILTVLGWDMLEHIYEPKALTNIFNFYAVETKNREDLMLVVAKPDVKQIETLRDLADIHLKLRMVEGNLIFYGEKPYTQPYIVNFDLGKGFRIPKLTPVK